MITYQSDTICALSTARGKGAIAIIRMSGPESIRIIDALFKGVRTIQQAPHACMTRGKIMRPAQRVMLDDVLVVKFEKPHSYTGQDLIEINCHGNGYLVQEILQELLQAGARLAEPGEFTKRAFINGKIDLLQAESIADVIEAQTQCSLSSAQQQLAGVLSSELFALRERVKKQLALLEIELDFSEDIEFVGRQELRQNVAALQQEIERLIATFRYGKIMREGVHIALIGKPNVGKSSILNRLLQEERAIVSEIPGTTRDVIEESLDIDGMLFKISDTAGLGLGKDVVEAQGIARSIDTMGRADQILFVVDAGAAPDERDHAIASSLQEKVNDAFLLLNKIDVVGNKVDRRFVRQFKHAHEISARTGAGFAAFKRALVESNRDNDAAGVAPINKARHLHALRRSQEFMSLAGESIDAQLSPEFIAFDIRAALDALGEITGDVTTEEILQDIFSSFCIGK
ncbi:tRNA uridine-5-carboxymethylaminomethyl(34) synthesis GTPase MnmE [candidate division KSB1 bacterium]|nr:tRNA uridine-5-carboxymethylaminomethyl(34) synthesis GTPase MnmE [candidate division KSB1 bacterium]